MWRGCGPRRANDLPVKFEPGDLAASRDKTDELILPIHTPITFLTDRLHRGILDSYAQHASNLGRRPSRFRANGGRPKPGNTPFARALLS